ncbi:Heterokaryon incompatibility protein (HET) domain containing protein [Rhypophila decipiens]
MSLNYNNARPYDLPLAENEIRLFRLFRYPDGSISGELQNFQLQHSPPFIATSYVWGEHDERRFIKLNGHGVDILKTAHAFFEEILAPDHYEQFPPTSWWWMDCICINQADLAERSAQVGLMSTIYRQAAMTVIWLGEEADESNVGMGFLNLLAEDYTVDEPYWKTNIQPHIAANSQGWKAVEKLLTRKWWERVWTLQEFLLGEDAVFFCGGKRISLDQMSAAIHAIWEWHQRRDHKIISRRGYERAWNRNRMLQWYEFTIRHSKHLPLIGILTYTATSSATDPRDRLYSLLGLLSPTELDIIGRPDYEASAGSIYTSCAVSFIKKYRTLDLLCIAPEMKENVAPGQESKGLVLPSWVPDWSLRRTHSPPMLCMANQSANPHMGNFRPLHSLHYKSAYRASGSEAAFPDGAVLFSEGCRELVCMGIILDEIDGVGGGKYGAGGNEYPDTEGEGVELAEVVQSTSSTNSPTAVFEPKISNELRNSITEQVARSLVLDRQDHYLGKSAPVPAFACMFRRICLQEQEMEESSVNSRILPALEVDYSDPITEISEWFHLNKRLGIRGMTLEEAVTGSGHEPGHGVDSKSGRASIHCGRGSRNFDDRARSPEPGTPVARSEGPDIAEDEDGQNTKKTKDGGLEGSEREAFRESSSSNKTETADVSNIETCADHHQIMQFAMRVRSTTFGRAKRLLVTSTGLLGMAPRTAKKGDVVCVLLGCSIPLVLRAGGDADFTAEGHEQGLAGGQQRRYTVIGEAYVDGYMNGEAVEHVNTGVRTKEEIRII